MASIIKFKRGTAANLATLASSNGLNVGEPYYITDTGRFAIGMTTSTYATFTPNPMTTVGDLIVGGTAGAQTRLGVGSNGQVLTVVSGVPTWSAAPGGTPSITATYIGYGDGSNLLTGSSDFTYSAGTLTIGSTIGTITSGGPLLQLNGLASSSSNGGNVITQGGAYSGTGSNTGGTVLLGGGVATNGSGGGGSAYLNGGNSSGGSGNGGSVGIQGGGSGSSSTGNGGDVTITGGHKASGGTGAGNVIISAGNSTHSSTSGTGGNLTLRPGYGYAAGSTGGSLIIQSGSLSQIQRLQITPTGAFSFGTDAVSYGTSGQVLTSNGNAPPTWQTVSGGGGSGIKFTQAETAPASPALGDIWLVPSTSTWYQRVTDTGSTPIWVEINNPGPSSGSGTATINFGAHPGSNEASVVITGQTNITTDKVVRAQFAFATLGNKTANDHRYMSLLVDLVCGPITAGVGFTIYATSTEKMTGSYTIQYTWN